MEQHPAAWVLFVPFIILTSFTVLNLFIALIVNSMQSVHTEVNEGIRANAELAHDEREALGRQLEQLTAEVRRLRDAVGTGR